MPTEEKSTAVPAQDEAAISLDIHCYNCAASAKSARLLPLPAACAWAAFWLAGDSGGSATATAEAAQAAVARRAKAMSPAVFKGI
mmetsp:Transcript_8489/g.16030  ORF Transcript_8489/g.16030 Transcript_8489/m.16030 type:complete len:85 (+) Transcript_8489:156-410(+)